MYKETFLEIGKIISTHGIKGFVELVGWCDDVCIFKSLLFLYFDQHGNIKRNIEKLQFKKNNILILFEGIDNMNKAKELVGKVVYVDRKDLEIEEDAIFIKDLIGIEIYDIHNKNIYYGKIKEVIKTGANDVYVIVNEEKKEKLIPVIDDVIIEKDLKNRKIYINVIEGLFDV